MAYDAAARKHILFGTQFGNDRHTWAFDLQKNEWTDLKPKSQPLTDRNDPVLAYDASAKKVIAVVRVIDRQEKDEILAGHVETWAYDSAANTWTEMNPPREPDGWGNRRRVMVAMPELNALLMEAYVNPTEKVKGVDREQQMWTYRTANAKPVTAMQPPQNVRVRTEKDAVVVEWDSVAGAEEYAVLRGTGESSWAAEYAVVGKLGSRTTAFTDRGMPRGKAAYYRVKAILKNGMESELSRVARAQPRVVDDVSVYASATNDVTISWAMPSEPDAAYHVERAPVEVLSDDQILRIKKDTQPLAKPSVGAIRKMGRFERITKEPVKPLGLGKTTAGTTWLSFRDHDIDLTKSTKVEGEALYIRSFDDKQLDPIGTPYSLGVYAYRVVAVNSIGVEGGPSAWALTIPPAVQHVYAKEDGEKCHLKWKGMSLESISSYRVYRMEGPKINGPGQPVSRLTANPVHDFLDNQGFHRFSDAKATKDTKRYWVVAVDKLGQEGFPSAPVWHWRQFRSYYEPFTSEWHQ